MKKYNHIQAVFAGLLLSSMAVPVATAEDIEIYTTASASGIASNPKIMFIVDTSGSMGTKTWVKPSYDSSKTYAGSCVSNGIYFVDDGKLPKCATSITNYFNESALACDHAVVGYQADGDKISPPQDGSLLMIGTYSDQLAQYDSVKKKWRELKIGTTAERDFEVECFSDNGNTVANGSNREYISDGGIGYTGTVPANPAVPHAVWAGGAGNLQLFAGNYVNYANWVPSTNTDPALGPVELVERSYLDQVKSAVEIMVRGNTRVDIGLMRFNEAAEGGPVTYPILDVGADRNDFFTRLKAFDAKGYTPLSEIYYESLLYFGGKAADYGERSTPRNQTGSTYISGGTKYYNSPISSECDKNYVVLLSDGKPKQDDLNVTRKKVLTGFDTGSCSTDITLDDADDDNRDAFSSDASTVDNCLDELAGWAHTNDVAEDASNPAHEGMQNITTHTIGFELSDPGAVRLMKDAAAKGGGKDYYAKSEAELIAIFNKIIANTLRVNTTFSSPAVSVNAFNRSTHLEDLYFTLFKPANGNHWDGNLKKYKLKFAVDTADVDGDGDTTENLPYVADQLNADAVDSTTGFFGDSALSYWSSPVNGSPDGKEVGLGGTANELTTSRKVYTFTGSYTDTDGVNVPSTKDLKHPSNTLAFSNNSITDAMLDITGNFPIVGVTPYRETLLKWASGLDALSQYGDVNTYDDVRLQMGDPLHAEPALVQYGGTPLVPDMVAYVATNDGYLHAFNTLTGAEIFSFVPQELLPNLSTVMEDLGGKKTYGLDGNVVAWINDVNKDGIISKVAGDHVYLYISMRRGGNNIYALDVTDRTSPELLWVIKGGTGKYTELGQTWSTVNVDKIKDGNVEKDVLIFGGGYDTAQDSALTRAADGVGRTIYIADAVTGERLWSAGKDGASPTGNMEYSIPARIQPLDISGDGLVDRLYAADMGGQIFRFDIDNNNGNALSASITGGRIVDIADSAEEDARRFYYPPDVALVDGKDGTYHALVISSGYRAHPLNTTINDRIYMIKDRNTGLIKTGYTTLTESDLHDATENLAGGDGADDNARKAELANIQGAEGWYINLDDEDNPGTWIGEKGLSEVLILEGVAIVTTYTPNVFAASSSCQPNVGLGKIFFLDILDATPAYPQNIDKRPQRHIKLKRGGIPPTPNVIITQDGEPTLCVGTECEAADLGLGVRKTYWFEVEK